MKVFYAYNFYQQPGGENQWFHSEPESVAAHGHEVVVYERDNKEIEERNLFQKARLFLEVNWSQRTYNEVDAILKRAQPDVGHIYNTLALISPSIYYACKDNGVPVVQTLYNYRLVCPAATLVRGGQVCTDCIDGSLVSSVRYRCYRDSYIQSTALSLMLANHRRRGTWDQVIDRYIVPTAFMKSLLADTLLPENRIVVKPNFHDPDPGINHGTRRHVLFVGRLAQEKGIRTLLRAWKQHNDLPVLRVIGDGPLATVVEQHAQAETEGSAIEFVGKVPHEEVIENVKHAITLVVPSEWYEAFPHVLLEAYGCGVPVVASDIGTLRDVVKDGVTGKLFEPGNPEDLHQAVMALVNNEDRSREFGRNARDRYLKEYTGARNYERLMAIYQDLANDRAEQSE